MADDIQPLNSAPAVKTPEQLRAEQAERERVAASDQAEADRKAAAAKADQAARDAKTQAAQSNISAEPTPASSPLPAAERVRAFEDEHLGKDVVRINGRIERGSGSPYQDPKVMTPELRRQHAALEKLTETEQKLADANTALLQAQADHDTALAAAEPKPDADAVK
jgi:hypothetical protein